MQLNSFTARVSKVEDRFVITLVMSQLSEQYYDQG